LKTALLTDTDLRAAWAKGERSICTVAEGTILTPTARDFIREHRMELRFETVTYHSMPMAAVPKKDGKAVYVEGKTGREMNEKPENMTHLHGNVLVEKTHPRIAFRGKLDSLAADILCVQVTAHEAGQQKLTEELEELRGAVLTLLSDEVLEKDAEPLCLFGMDSETIRYTSHHVKETIGVEHLMPQWQMGRLPVELNRLRTRIRETELCAAMAFDGGHTDIIEALNRLSSAAYILYCRTLAGYYDGGKP